jgi:hypothetical protein
MRDCAETARLSSQDRCIELARILAAGILRLYMRGILPVEPSRPATKNRPESGDPGLELSGDPWLSVRGG